MRCSPRLPKRRSVASAISSPPPSAWPVMAATNTSGVCSILRRASCMIRTVAVRERWVPDLKAATSAPALKNLSDALLRTTAPISSSRRQSSIALPSSRAKATS